VNQEEEDILEAEVVEEATTMKAKMQLEEEAEEEVDIRQVIVTETVKHKARQQWSTGEHAAAMAQTAVLQNMEVIDELCSNENVHI
jgi:hypothetical protein